MELKKLTDISYINDYVDHLCDVDLLRKIAADWVKSLYEEENNIHGILSNDELQAIIDWIMNFFDLTEAEIGQLK